MKPPRGKTPQPFNYALRCSTIAQHQEFSAGQSPADRTEQSP